MQRSVAFEEMVKTSIPTAPNHLSLCSAPAFPLNARDFEFGTDTQSGTSLFGFSDTSKYALEIAIELHTRLDLALCA